MWLNMHTSLVYLMSHLRILSNNLRVNKIPHMFSIKNQSISRIIKMIILILLNSFLCFSQKVDTVIDKKIYTSYYSFDLKVPLYITYYLYKGGGNSTRINFKEEYKSAKNSDYVRSGYHRGHLVSAEDFAYNQELENITFSYYNCLPQYPKLNMGPWKSWETKIRQESQIWPLKIYVGGIYGSKKLKNGVAVPDYCWKVIFNQKTGLILHILMFKNDETCETKRTSLNEINRLTGYKITFNSK